MYLLRMEEMALSDYVIVNPGLNHQLAQVKYSFDLDELEPEVLSLNQENGSLSMLLGKLGDKKSEYWSFQQECINLSKCGRINFKYFERVISHLKHLKPTRTK